MQPLLLSCPGGPALAASSPARPPLSRLPRSLASFSPLCQRSLSVLVPRRPSSSPSPLSFSRPVASLSEVKRGAAIRAAVASATALQPPNDEAEKAKLAQVSKRLMNTARYFKRLGSLGFWGQLVCTVVAAVILSFSAVVTGKITSLPTFYATAGGIAAAFVSVFWSFGYIRLSERLQRTANEPSSSLSLSQIQCNLASVSASKTFQQCWVYHEAELQGFTAPPRADVVKSLKNGIVVNLLGMGAAVLGMQATVGLLVAKALTTSVVPYYQGVSASQSPVLALDVFLVQASANTILSHFLGLVFSLELLRAVTLPNQEPVLIPRAA